MVEVNTATDILLQLLVGAAGVDEEMAVSDVYTVAVVYDQYSYAGDCGGCRRVVRRFLGFY